MWHANSVNRHKAIRYVATTNVLGVVCPFLNRTLITWDSPHLDRIAPTARYDRSEQLDRIDPTVI